MSHYFDILCMIIAWISDNSLRDDKLLVTLCRPSHGISVAPHDPGGISPDMKLSNSDWGRLRLAAVRLSTKLRAQQRLVK